MSVALPAHALLLGFAEQVREGKVMNVSAKEAGNMLNDGWMLLDVRPPNEIAKARRGSARGPASSSPLPATCMPSGERAPLLHPRDHLHGSQLRAGAARAEHLPAS